MQQYCVHSEGPKFRLICLRNEFIYIKRIPLQLKTRYHVVPESERGADGGKAGLGTVVARSYFEV